MSDIRHVWVELKSHESGDIIRIFRGKKAALDSARPIAYVERPLAVENIRYQLWLRSKGFCELCGAIVTEQSGHMHEQKSRGKGGEISIGAMCPVDREVGVN